MEGPNSYLTRAEADQRYVIRLGEEHKELVKDVNDIKSHLAGGYVAGRYRMGISGQMTILTWMGGICVAVGVPIAIFVIKHLLNI